MSLIHNIDHIARAPGVISILVDADGRTAHRGEHHEALRLALLQRDELGVPQTSTTAGMITIMVQREPGGTAAVAVLTGHEIRKSLRRMIRKAARPDRPPAAKTTPMPTASLSISCSLADRPAAARFAARSTRRAGASRFTNITTNHDGTERCDCGSCRHVDPSRRAITTRPDFTRTRAARLADRAAARVREDANRLELELVRTQTRANELQSQLTAALADERGRGGD